MKSFSPKLIFITERSGQYLYPDFACRLYPVRSVLLHFFSSSSARWKLRVKSLQSNGWNRFISESEITFNFQYHLKFNSTIVIKSYNKSFLSSIVIEYVCNNLFKTSLLKFLETYHENFVLNIFMFSVLIVEMSMGI